MQLLPGIVVGLYRLGRILAFKKMSGGEIVMGRLHDIRVRVVPSEGFGLPEYVVSRLNRRNLKWALLIIESCNRIRKQRISHQCSPEASWYSKLGRL